MQHGETAGEVVIEWAPFRAKDGVDEAQLLDAAEAIQRDFLRHQPGFLGRELLRASGGGWVDLLQWRDEASAAAAMQAAMESTTCRAYFQLMEGAESPDFGADVLHLRRVRTY